MLRETKKSFFSRKTKKLQRIFRRYVNVTNKSYEKSYTIRGARVN